MTWPIDLVGLSSRLDYNNDRISQGDAIRQFQTVEDILSRLADQPGIVLADEVGMGKTFVALGVAMMAALNDRDKRPVVVMVPPSLHEKWPRDFKVFQDRVVRHARDKVLRVASAASGLEFFRLLDYSAKDRPQIIFLKHGAFHLQNIDHWVRLALIKRALVGMHLGERRNSLPRFAARLLRKRSTYDDPTLFAKLLQEPNASWRNVINAHYRERPQYQIDYAPIPAAIQRLLESDDLNIEPLRKCLRKLPARESALIESRLEDMRAAINGALRDIWPATLAKARFRSPLLILDEAHHLKNPATRLASLFVVDEAKDDAQAITGVLDGAFERMMFLTATPFQLGHRELLNVIDRFGGVAWKTLSKTTKAQFTAEINDLGLALDRAQHMAAELDKRWWSLRQEDLFREDGSTLALEDWWNELIQNPESQSERVQVVLRAFEKTLRIMKECEKPLRKWVIRHLRSRYLPDSSIIRRTRLVGQAIAFGADSGNGLPVKEGDLLPFLLAARAQAVAMSESKGTGRATFAEGLASSYEAFLDTRKGSSTDEELVADNIGGDRINRYVEKLAHALPNEAAYAQHPKVAPLVARVLDLWSQGEKVVVFCHYRQTGRALVRHVSAALEKRLWNDASQRLGLDRKGTRKAVTDFGGRFDVEGGMRRPLYDEITNRSRSICGT